MVNCTNFTHRDQVLLERVLSYLHIFLEFHQLELLLNFLNPSFFQRLFMVRNSLRKNVTLRLRFEIVKSEEQNLNISQITFYDSTASVLGLVRTPIIIFKLWVGHISRKISQFLLMIESANCNFSNKMSIYEHLEQKRSPNLPI